MTDEITITRFQIGAEVPSWLLDQEPVHSHSQRGTFRFTTPCDVIDTPGYYVILPIATGPLPSVIDFDGGGVRIFAAGKPVRLMYAQQVFLGQEVDGYAHTLPFLEQRQPVLNPVTPRKRSFWDRVLGR